MKKYLFFVIAFFLVACSSRENGAYVDISQSEETLLNKQIDTIEVIPLELTKHSALGAARSLRVYSKYFFVEDINGIIYVFTKEGKYISNSHQATGHGRGEIGGQILAYNYNESCKTIEIVIVGKILFYDINFNYITEIYLDGAYKYVYGIDNISENHRVLISSSMNRDFVVLDLNVQTKQITEVESDFAPIATITRQCRLIYRKENEIVFCPPFYSRKIYRMSNSLSELIPKYHLSITNKSFNDDDLLSYKNNTRELSKYIMHNNYSYPLVHAFSDDYLIVYVRKRWVNDYLLFVNLSNGQTMHVNKREYDANLFSESFDIENNNMFFVMEDVSKLDWIEESFRVENHSQLPMSDSVYYKNSKIIRYHLK